MSFHDAIGFSPALNKSDGSLMKFSDVELEFPQNAGIDTPVITNKAIALRFPAISYGDYIQFAAAVAIRNCAGPRIKFWHGRPDPTAASPPDMIPDPSDSVTKMLDRMGDAGFTPEELIDLLASHSLAVQEDIDKTIPFTPFDSTPTVFDTQFFVETLLEGTMFPGNGSHPGEVMSPFPDEFRLQSDFLLARDSRTSCYWQSFIEDESVIGPRFAKAMEKLSLVGQDKGSLVDCSHMVPDVVDITPRPPHIPAGKSLDDIEASCTERPFPTITTDSGPETSIPKPPKGNDGDDDEEGDTEDD
ncbi:heme peroxidase [Dendrothele bispora CBS 962.96]|uniref:Peroxidase n=1 Tax=Dendrothele bispora (strain CBS 962.96) TaxID=1314807 RepID=A0A4S8M440_DENBC|nr:heme peroxidase [Dendrothele bispora CBS 962.96]